MPGFGVLIRVDAAIRTLHLHDRSIVDEQAGHVDRFGERAAAVPAEVDHDGVDVLGLEFFEQPADVAGGALVSRQAQAGAVHVHVEARQLDHADAVRLAVRLGAALDDLAAGFAVLELDAVAGDGVGLAARLVGRIDFQADDRAPLAADLLRPRR